MAVPPSPSKKHKSGSASRATKSITDFENSLAIALKSNASLNPLNDLLQLAQSAETTDIALKCIFALYRTFTLIIRKGILSSSNNNDGGQELNEERRTVRSWVIVRLEAYTALLCSLLQDEEKTLRLSSLKILFSLLRELSSTIIPAEASDSSSNHLQFDVPFFQKIVRALLVCPASTYQHKKRKNDRSSNEIQLDVRDLFLDTWLNVYADIRWFFLRESAILMENQELVSKNPNVPVNALSILEKLTGMPASEAEAKTKAESESHQQQFWIEALNKAPKLKKRGKNVDAQDEDEDDDDGDETAGADADDWRKFFEDPKPEQTKAKGGRRLYTLPVHAQLHTPASHRAVFTRAWLSLLPLLSTSGTTTSSTASARGDQNEGEGGDQSEDGDEEQMHLALVARALVVMHQRVLPYLTRAVLIMDWTASHVSSGGYVGLLALNTLFTLMTLYNLDYPAFYTRLYAYVDRRVLHIRHRARFFRLMERVLGSTHLPKGVLASFVKRVGRVSLGAGGAGVVMCVPFVYNVLKRHPALMCMIHKTDGVGAGAGGDNNDNGVGAGEWVDPFDMEEEDPMKTGALESSLWELASHRSHYHGPAATLARLLEEAFTRPGFSMEDFLDHTYATLFETEVNRRMRKEPVVIEKEFFEPLVVNTKEDEEEGVHASTDVVNDIWVLS